LLVLKQKLKVTYRDLIEMLKANSLICSLIKLERIPHHTTLVKFAKRIKLKIINLLLNHKKAKTAAIDSTGFELEAKSFYFRCIKGDTLNPWRKTKRFMKLTIAVDTDEQIVMTHRIRRDNKYGQIEFRAMLKELDLNYILADAWYDCGRNRIYAFSRGVIPVIPLRNDMRSYGYLKQNKKISGDNYHQRSKVETVFSVIKRKYGSVLKSRSYITQKVEVICKLIAYNIDRQVRLSCLLMLGFQQSFLGIGLKILRTLYIYDSRI
jgi:hypothetical protein